MTRHICATAAAHITCFWTFMGCTCLYKWHHINCSICNLRMSNPALNHLEHTVNTCKYFDSPPNLLFLEPNNLPSLPAVLKTWWQKLFPPEEMEDVPIFFGWNHRYPAEQNPQRCKILNSSRFRSSQGVGETIEGIEFLTTKSGETQWDWWNSGQTHSEIYG